MLLHDFEAASYWKSKSYSEVLPTAAIKHLSEMAKCNADVPSCFFTGL